MFIKQFTDNTPVVGHEEPRLVFSYMRGPLDYDSSIPRYSIEVFEDNTVRLHEFRASEASDVLEVRVRPFTGITFEVSRRITNQIIQIVRQHEGELNEMPEYLDFVVDDGCVDCFRFWNKEIYANNIERQDLVELKRKYGHHDEYCRTVAYGNRLLDIYDQIARSLSGYDLLRSTDKQEYHTPGFGNGMDAISGCRDTKNTLVSQATDR